MYCCFYFKYSSKVYLSKHNDLFNITNKKQLVKIYTERRTVALIPMSIHISTIKIFNIGNINVHLE